MNVVTQQMDQASDWRSAFAEALIAARPEVNPDAADELADSAYLSLSALSPADAAALWARSEFVSRIVKAADLFKRGKLATRHGTLPEMPQPPIPVDVAR